MGLWCLLRDSQPHTSWHETAGAVFYLQAGMWGTRIGLQNGRGLSAPHVWGHSWEARLAGSAWNVWSRTTRAGDLETEARSWRSNTPELRARHKATANAVWSWQKTRYVPSWGQAVSPAMSPHVCVSGVHDGERIVSLIKSRNGDTDGENKGTVAKGQGRGRGRVGLTDTQQWCCV